MKNNDTLDDTTSTIFAKLLETTATSTTNHNNNNHICDEYYIAQHICHYIGRHQYRFISTINHQWYATYTQIVFPNDDSSTSKDYTDYNNDYNQIKNQRINGNHHHRNLNRTTYYNLYTLSHTKICYQESFPTSWSCTTTALATTSIATSTSSDTAVAVMPSQSIVANETKNVDDMKHQHWIFLCRLAARYGNLLCFQYILEARKNNMYGEYNGTNSWYNDKTIFSIAAVHGHLSIVQYILQEYEDHTNGNNDSRIWYTQNRKLMYNIAKNGHVHIIQYLHSKYGWLVWDQEAYEIIAIDKDRGRHLGGSFNPRFLYF